MEKSKDASAEAADTRACDGPEMQIDSVALARLLEEVRNDEPSEPHAYNRMHNRHNR